MRHCPHHHNFNVVLYLYKYIHLYIYIVALLLALICCFTACLIISVDYLLYQSLSCQLTLCVWMYHVPACIYNYCNINIATKAVISKSLISPKVVDVYSHVCVCLCTLSDQCGCAVVSGANEIKKILMHFSPYALVWSSMCTPPTRC